MKLYVPQSLPSFLLLLTYLALYIYSMMADYQIQMADGDRVGEFYVKFHGPKTSMLLLLYLSVTVPYFFYSCVYTDIRLSTTFPIRSAI